MTPRVHWIGAGLSSVPGIRRLAASGRPFTLWNRTVAKAHAALEGLGKLPQADVQAWDENSFRAALQPGDVAVSMLPADRHVEIAKICLDKKAHLVTTSYLSDAMRGLHDEAQVRGLSFVNECGLDPGIDHLFAHELIDRFKASAAVKEADAIEFESHCGGFPVEPGEFRYKFSWSPLGVLRALKNSARYLKNGQVTTAERPWDHLGEHVTQNGRFEVYPNRDSLPYVEEYRIPKEWPLKNFMRGTLRPQGWKQAWSEVFTALPKLTAAELENLSQDLMKRYAYASGEKDRVVLSVGLRASKQGREIWREAYLLDYAGAGADSAMAQLVSYPAALAVEAVLEKRIAPGVHGLPADAELRRDWLAALAPYGLIRTA